MTDHCFRAMGLALSCVSQENKQEGKRIWKMFKNDPLSPAGAYWRNFGMPGIGLFLEGYVVSDTPHPHHHWPFVVLLHYGQRPQHKGSLLT